MSGEVAHVSVTLLMWPMFTI